MNQKDKADILNAIKELDQRVSQIESDIGRIKQEVTANQPSKKFKVAESATDKDNNLITKFANKTAREVGLTVKKRSGVSTSEFNKILRENDVDVSRPTVINIMRRYASEFDEYKVLEPKQQVRKSLHLRHKG